MMPSTFKQDDVTLLLKDISGLIKPLPANVREPLIQSGVHYSEMLPLEYAPTEKYIRAFETALESYAAITASAVERTAEAIISDKGPDVVLVSLARAGIPIGILIKHRIEFCTGSQVPHYSISIIRGKGIDKNAVRYILSKHAGEAIQFVDGWTGKGAIQQELNASMEEFPGIDSRLAVLSDPANVTSLCGTHKDFLIASSCLNSTVSGLISRTVLRDDIIGPSEFHGAAYYPELIKDDLTYHFIDKVESAFGAGSSLLADCSQSSRSGIQEVLSIAADFEISDINLIKPGIGEATRVLLRRIPWKLLVRSKTDQAHLGHLYQLARERGVSVEEYPLINYKACGIIREMADS